jgi:hypothetical protein
MAAKSRHYETHNGDGVAILQNVECHSFSEFLAELKPNHFPDPETGGD